MNNQEVENFIKKIEDTLKNVHNKDIGQSRTDWSKAYHDALTIIDTKNFDDYTKLNGNNVFREFMVDFSLSKKMEDDWKQGYEGIFLACETEWGNEDDVVYDFQKLAVIKAKIKLIVFQIEKDTNDNFQKYCNKLKKSISFDLLNDGSVYCFFCSGTSFEHRFYRYPEAL